MSLGSGQHGALGFKNFNLCNSVFSASEVVRQIALKLQSHRGGHLHERISLLEQSVRGTERKKRFFESP